METGKLTTENPKHSFEHFARELLARGNVGSDVERPNLRSNRVRRGFSELRDLLGRLSEHEPDGYFMLRGGKCELGERRVKNSLGDHVIRAVGLLTVNMLPSAAMETVEPDEERPVLGPDRHAPRPRPHGAAMARSCAPTPREGGPPNEAV